MLLGRVRSRRALVLPRSDRHHYDDDNYYDNYGNYYYNYQSADRALRRFAEIAPTLRLRVHRVEAVRRWRMLLAAVDLARRSVVLPRPRVSARLRPDAVASPGVRLHRHRRRAVRGEGVLLGRLIRLRSNQVLPPQLRSVARTSYRPIGRYRRSRHRNTHTHTRLTALFPGLPGWAGTRKVKPIWILLKQETESGSGISWAYASLTSLQTDNHASIPPLSFLQSGCPSCRPTNSVKALKAQDIGNTLKIQ